MEHTATPCSSCRTESTLYLSLGSNMGNRRVLLDSAVQMIAGRIGRVEAVSEYVETEPWGFVSTHLFLNIAVRVATTLTPWQVLEQTQLIERELGRTAKSTDGHYHDRPIDIDLLMYDDVVVDEWRMVLGRRQRLTLPHPLMHKRDFVMVPLRQVLRSEPPL